MNFRDLRIIVKQIRENVACPKCQGKYTEEDIEIIGNLGDEHTFFYAICPECDSESVINVALHFEDELPMTLPNLTRLGSSPRMAGISMNEVLDMHNFLKGFSGDFAQLFGEKTDQPTS